MRLLKGFATAVFLVVFLALFSGAQDNKRLPSSSFEVPVENVSFHRVPVQINGVKNDEQKQYKFDKR